MKEFVLPKKWCIKSNEDNAELLEKFFRSKSNEYQGYNPKWKLNDTSYYHYPQHQVPFWGSYQIESGYIEISLEEFIDHVLNKKEDILSIKEDYSDLKKLLKEII